MLWHDWWPLWPGPDSGRSPDSRKQGPALFSLLLLTSCNLSGVVEACWKVRLSHKSPLQEPARIWSCDRKCCDTQTEVSLVIFSCHYAGWQGCLLLIPELGVLTFPDSSSGQPSPHQLQTGSPYYQPLRRWVHTVLRTRGQAAGVSQIAANSHNPLYFILLCSGLPGSLLTCLYVAWKYTAPYL